LVKPALLERNSTVCS